VRASLKRYKASVLKAAVGGKLTEEWRRLRIKGSPSKELSKVWSYSILGDISHKITDGEHLRPKTAHSGIPFLSAKDIREHGVTFDNVLYVQEDDAAKFRKRCNPERGDILVVSRGATVGRSCIVNTDRIFCLLGSVILIKSKESILKKFLSYALKSPNIQKQLIALSGSTAQQAIYIRDIKKTVVPLPHLDEQQKIVEEIESRLSVTEEIEETININLKRAERLRQAVLKKAFSGRLVSDFKKYP
jgi:type I restriction enzyme S subunit